MIIYGLGQLALKLISGVFVVALPSFPDAVTSALTSVQSMLVSGVGLVRGIFGYTILHAAVTCCRLVLLLFALWLAWDILRWILAKIPMLGLGK